MVIECSVKHHVRRFLVPLGTSLNSEKHTAKREAEHEEATINEGDPRRTTPSEHRQNWRENPRWHSMPESNLAFFPARLPQEWGRYFSEHRRKDMNRAFPVAFPAGYSSIFLPQTPNPAEIAKCFFHNGILRTSRFRTVPPCYRTWQPLRYRRSTAETKTTSLYGSLYRLGGRRSRTFRTENQNNPNIGNFMGSKFAISW